MSPADSSSRIAVQRHNQPLRTTKDRAMNSNLITYLASGILGTVLGLVTLVVGEGVEDGNGVACSIVDCLGQDQVVPCPPDDPDCRVSEAIELACESGSGGCANGTVLPCNPEVDCLESGMDVACSTADGCDDRVGPCEPSDPGCDGIIEVVDDGRGGGKGDRVTPCDNNDPDCQVSTAAA